MMVRRLVQGAVAGLSLALLMGADCLRLPSFGYRCQGTRGADACPGDQVCCSDDPAAIGGALPDYQYKDIPDSDLPLFSEVNNSLSSSGICFQPFDALTTGGIFQPRGCPIPCNPTWDERDVIAVCGEGQQCCQTAELQESDCILDQDMGCYRPITGDDHVEGRIDWTDGPRGTRQDPRLQLCAQLADQGVDNLYDCYRQLTAANQRGFCMHAWTSHDGERHECPHVDPTYVDACELLNMREGLACE